MHGQEIPEEKREKIEGWNYPKRYQEETIKKDVTQKEAIETAVSYMKKYLKDNCCCDVELEMRAHECAVCALKIVAAIFGALWW